MKIVLNSCPSGGVPFGSLLLFVLSCTSVVIGAIVVTLAYFNFCRCNESVKTTIDGVSNGVTQTTDPNQQQALSALAERLLYIHSESTQRNTITFLFTVFSVALVSGSAYILERSRRDVLAVEEKVGQLRKDAADASNVAQETRKTTTEAKREVELYLKSLSTPWRIGASLWTSSRISQEMRTAAHARKFYSLAASERDFLGVALSGVQGVQRGEFEVMGVECEAFLNEARDIKLNLEAVPEKFHDTAESLITTCSEIIGILTEVCKAKR